VRCAKRRSTVISSRMSVGHRNVSHGSALVSRVERAHDDMRHVDRLVLARPTVDNRPPKAPMAPSRQVPAARARKEMVEQAAVADIKMISNIAKEMSRTPSLSVLNRKGPTTLNGGKRRKEMRRIDIENERMLKRLEGVRPSYKVAAQSQQYKDSRKYASLASAHAHDDQPPIPMPQRRVEAPPRSHSTPALRRDVEDQFFNDDDFVPPGQGGRGVLDPSRAPVGYPHSSSRSQQPSLPAIAASRRPSSKEVPPMRAAPNRRQLPPVSSRSASTPGSGRARVSSGGKEKRLSPTALPPMARRPMPEELPDPLAGIEQRRVDPLPFGATAEMLSLSVHDDYEDNLLVCAEEDEEDDAPAGEQKAAKGCVRVQDDGLHDNGKIARDGTGFLRPGDLPLLGATLHPDAIEKSRVQVEDDGLHDTGNVKRAGTSFVRIGTLPDDDEEDEKHVRVEDDGLHDSGKVKRQSTGYIKVPAMEADDDEEDEKHVRVEDDGLHDSGKVKRQSTGYINVGALPAMEADEDEEEDEALAADEADQHSHLDDSCASLFSNGAEHDVAASEPEAMSAMELDARHEEDRRRYEQMAMETVVTSDASVQQDTEAAELGETCASLFSDRVAAVEENEEVKESTPGAADVTSPTSDMHFEADEDTPMVPADGFEADDADANNATVAVTQEQQLSAVDDKHEHDAKPVEDTESQRREKDAPSEECEEAPTSESPAANKKLSQSLRRNSEEQDDEYEEEFDEEFEDESDGDAAGSDDDDDAADSDGEDKADPSTDVASDEHQESKLDESCDSFSKGAAEIGAARDDVAPMQSSPKRDELEAEDNEDAQSRSYESSVDVPCDDQQEVRSAHDSDEESDGDA